MQTEEALHEVFLMLPAYDEYVQRHGLFLLLQSLLKMRQAVGESAVRQKSKLLERIPAY
jgi:hypothetical protein